MRINLDSPGRDFYNFFQEYIKPLNKKICFIKERGILKSPINGDYIYSNTLHSPTIAKHITQSSSLSTKQKDTIYVYSSIFPDDTLYLEFEKSQDFDYSLSLHINCSDEKYVREIKSQMYNASSLFAYNVPFVANTYINDYFKNEIIKKVDDVEKRFILLKESLYQGKLINLSSNSDIEAAINNFKSRNQHVKGMLKCWT